MVVWKFGSWISTSPRKAHFLFLMYRCHAVEKMTRNSIALMRDGSVMADSDLVDFLSGPTDSAINFNGSADLHTPIHPPLVLSVFLSISGVNCSRTNDWLCCGAVKRATYRNLGTNRVFNLERSWTGTSYVCECNTTLS